MSSKIKRAEDLASDANEDLKNALPYLEASNKAIGTLSLTKSSIAEIKAYSAPPRDIMTVMAAVMTLLGKSNLDWASIKREMTDPKFSDKIMCLDKDNMSEETMKRI